MCLHRTGLDGWINGWTDKYMKDTNEVWSTRSKVTVIARPLVSNETEEDYHQRHAGLSFYFTVVKARESKWETMMGIVQVQPGRTLADNDLTPPSCGLLCMDQCRPGDCQGWTARVKECKSSQKNSFFYIGTEISAEMKALNNFLFFSITVCKKNSEAKGPEMEWRFKTSNATWLLPSKVIHTL